MTFFAGINTLEQAYTADQTDTLIVNASSTQRIVVTEITVNVDEAVTVNGVAYRIGFGSPSTPTTTGVVISHPGLPPGEQRSRGTGAGNIGSGDFNEDLRITCENPVGGSLRVLVTYYIEESA